MLAKPNKSLGKCYAGWMVLLILFKIISGALTYSGCDDNGKSFINVQKLRYDLQYNSGTVDDYSKSFHVSYQNQIPSIILLALGGIISAVCVLKNSA